MVLLCNFISTSSPYPTPGAVVFLADSPVIRGYESLNDVMIKSNVMSDSMTGAISDLNDSSGAGDDSSSECGSHYLGFYKTIIPLKTFREGRGLYFRRHPYRGRSSSNIVGEGTQNLAEIMAKQFLSLDSL